MGFMFINWYMPQNYSKSTTTPNHHAIQVPSTKKKIRSNQPSGDDCSSTRLLLPQKHTGSDFDAAGLTIKSCGAVISKWKRWCSQESKISLHCTSWRLYVNQKFNNKTAQHESCLKIVFPPPISLSLSQAKPSTFHSISILSSTAPNENT